LRPTIDNKLQKYLHEVELHRQFFTSHPSQLLSPFSIRRQDETLVGDLNDGRSSGNSVVVDSVLAASEDNV
jgi:hypothetical protein